MTTSIRRILSPDLFVENGSILFDRRRAVGIVDDVPPLGAVTFLATDLEVSGTLEHRAIACGNEAVSLVRNAYNEEFRLWMFVSDCSWKPTNRIARHNKLWKFHSDLLGSNSVIKIGEEVPIESDHLVRYAGLLEISFLSCDKAINAVRTNPSFSMFFSNRPIVGSVDDVRAVFSAAFPKKDGIGQTSVDWLSLAIHLCPQGDILLRVTGLFDDREAAVDLIAQEKSVVAIGEQMSGEKRGREKKG